MCYLPIKTNIYHNIVGSLITFDLLLTCMRAAGEENYSYASRKGGTAVYEVQEVVTPEGAACLTGGTSGGGAQQQYL